MLSALTAVVDRRLARAIVRRARRRWPLLALVPASWLAPAVSPVAARLRRGLVRGAIVVATIATAVAMLADHALAAMAIAFYHATH